MNDTKMFFFNLDLVNKYELGVQKSREQKYLPPMTDIYQNLFITIYNTPYPQACKKGAKRKTQMKKTNY